MLNDQVLRKGFGIKPDVLGTGEIARLLQQMENAGLPRSRAGIRHAMKHSAVVDLAKDSRLLGLAREILGLGAIPFRATLFDKSPTANCWSFGTKTLRCPCARDAKRPAGDPGQ